MKKFLKIAFFILLCVFFAMFTVSCDDANDENAEYEVAPRIIVEQAVENRAYIDVIVRYDTSGRPKTSIATCRETEDNIYEVYGKVSVKDKFGDSYTGKFEAIAEYDPETKLADVKEFDLETPTKDE